jgi:hypothetical protein
VVDEGTVRAVEISEGHEGDLVRRDDAEPRVFAGDAVVCELQPVAVGWGEERTLVANSLTH